MLRSVRIGNSHRGLSNEQAYRSADSWEFTAYQYQRASAVDTGQTPQRVTTH